ncbi:MAG: DUF3300 domain-containing protein [Gammaproteobacteria bacterium]|nr:DUF3300 domain-containing protein [Gammaproteobacteria bacterium]MDH3576333.1 DUF3300 domain-containing protein [Gammaproteobacteria bacterium]
MKYRLHAKYGLARTFLASFAWLALLPAAALAQVPVDESGEIIGDFEKQYSEPATGNEDIPLLSTVELEELVGPIALYPDDLLAIVLPAAAYPLQIVDAARFLEALEKDPSLEPDPDWDDTVVALLNYPEVIELLNDDIDWTWRLGEAVVSQQSDVVVAIETFRDRAYAAGNLKSDSYQNVARNEGVIEITPVAEDVIYVPYYEPARVIVYQPRPVYYYYPRPYPVYYYPYSSAHAFNRGYFWGVTTAFTIGWYSDSLNVFHHSYFGHPYYGRSYWDRWWYRRPSRTIYNTTYLSNNTNITVNRYYGGDRWRPRDNRRDYVSTRRVTRNRHYPSPRPQGTRTRVTRIDNQEQNVRNNTRRREDLREPIAFRERPRNTATGRTAGIDRRRQTARVTPRTETAARTRTETARTLRQPQTRDRRQEPQDRRRDTRQRRSDPTPKLRRAEPAVPVRRNEAERQTRRPAPAPATRRAEPQRQVRQAAPQRQLRQATPQRQEKVQRRSSDAKEARQSSVQKSERSSKRQSSKRQPSSRTSERRR